MHDPQPFHGLTQMAARKGWRRLDTVRRGDAYLSERSVFRDTSTGCTIWRMTSDPAVDVDDYHDIPSWNADGSVIGFLSGRTGDKLRWLMDANGANLRPMPTPPGGPQSSAGYWSVIHRDRFYYSTIDADGTHVMALNPFTGEVQEIVGVPGDCGVLMPPHPSERTFLFGKRQDRPGETPTFHPEISDEASWIYVVGLEGDVREIALERRWHRLRFTKADDQRIFFNFDNPRTQYTILPDGSERHEIPYAGSHPDWTVGGAELTYYADGSIWGVQYDGTGRREVIRLGSGGHGGPTRDGTHMVSDTHGGENPLYPESVLTLRTDGTGVAHPIFRHQSSFYAHSQLWHPDHHSTHAHPAASPDGTKQILNSDMLGEFSDVYIGINRLPDPPRDLRVRLDGRSIMLNWTEPAQARELRGYNIHRYDEETHAWKLLTYRPQRGTGWRGPQRKEPAYYVVTAVEHSGLESRPSNQVYQLGNEYWDGLVRMTWEAEAAEMAWPMHEMMDPIGASNRYYAGCEGRVSGGSVRFPVDLPASRDFRIWARVRGAGALAVTVDGAAVGEAACSADDWSWVAAGAPRRIMSGAHEIIFTPTTGGECLDEILVTDDAALVPVGLMGLDSAAPEVPSGLTAEPADSNAILLKWNELKSGELDHFNVYCGTAPEFECAQGALVGSPSEHEFVDWGLRPGGSVWYRVTSVDRFGNESAQCEPIAATLPEVSPSVHLLLSADKARRRGMELEQEPAVQGKVLARSSQLEEPSAEWGLSLPASGLYALWGRSTHRREEPAVFGVEVDGESLGTWQVWGRWGEWVWSPMGRKWTGSPELFEIGAGRHTLRLLPRTPTSRIADVVITNDPSWWPMVGFRGPDLPVEPPEAPR